MRILVIEDDTTIGHFTQKGLTEAGYSVQWCTDGKDALDFIDDASFDLLILDLMLPNVSGLDLLAHLRKRGGHQPVLILSAKRSVDERVEGLSRGADDYLVKPFAFSELLARVQALLRRPQVAMTEVSKLALFGLEMDLLKREVHRAGEKIELQAKEFALLEYFLRNPNTPISKTMILEKVYAYNFDTQTNVVDVLVCRLRNKVDRDFKEKLIHTQRGIGYVFKKD